MKLCLFASYTYKRKSIRVFRTPILVYLDVRGVEIPLLSTVSISNCRYQEAPGEVVWSDFLAQLPRRSIEILWHLTRPSGLVKCQRISILLLGNCARISHTFTCGPGFEVEHWKVKRRRLVNITCSKFYGRPLTAICDSSGDPWLDKKIVHN